MKLTILIVCLSLMTSLGAVYSQNSHLSFKVSNLSLKEVLSEIEDQTKYSFLYKADLVNHDQRVSFDVTDASITEILDMLALRANFNYEILDNSVIVLTNPTEWVARQALFISGRVTDSSGAALPGVTVLVKGTTQGTITDVSGNYSIKGVESDAILIFSFVGMKTQEIPVSGKTMINAVMKEDAIGIDEVVAIGYGSIKKKDLTSSITSVTSGELNKGAVKDPITALQGKVPGLNITKDGSPYGGSSIILRGVSSLSLSGSPYIIVDGMPNGMMPAMDDIVSIDVLRDASATAIYGSRAANGVIIITTKKGQTGQPLISYNSYMAMETVANSIDMMSGEEYRKYISDNGLALNPEDDMGVNTDWQECWYFS